MAKTIGIVEVALFAAGAPGVPPVAIKSTLRLTRSAAKAGNRSKWPSAERYSIDTFCPAIKPVSAKPCWNAACNHGCKSGDVLLSNPITGIAVCCARKAPGHAMVVPAQRIRRSRRFKSSTSLLRAISRTNLPLSLLSYQP